MYIYTSLRHDVGNPNRNRFSPGFKDPWTVQHDSTYQHISVKTTSWWFQPNLKNISQIGKLPQVGVKVKNISNHHLDYSSPPYRCDIEMLTMWVTTSCGPTDKKNTQKKPSPHHEWRNMIQVLQQTAIFIYDVHLRIGWFGTHLRMKKPTLSKYEILQAAS